MKTTLKLLGLLFFVVIIMVSCEAGPEHQAHYEDDWKKVDPDKLYQLHEYIRPTKPIRIPDTMTVLMRPATLENPLDTTTSNPQDSIPQENME